MAFSTHEDAGSRRAGATLRHLLRDATRSIHDRLEAIWTPAGGFVDAEHFRAFLSLLLNAHCRLGVPAATLLGPQALALEHQRIDALCEDLNIPEAPWLQEPDAATPVVHAADAWGISYVLNGSALGAGILLRGTSLEPGWPTRYLQLGRDYVQNGDLKRFFEDLNAQQFSLKGTLRGANAVFASLAAEARDDVGGSPSAETPELCA